MAIRLFRETDGSPDAQPVAVYLLAYIASLLVSIWTFETYGQTLIWTANGILLAAVLQLPGRSARPLFAVCFVLNLLANLYRSYSPENALLFCAFNALEVSGVALATRLFCGASLDLRRPRRLARFVGLGVFPICLLISATGAMIVDDGDSGLAHLFVWFVGSMAGLLLVTPAFLLLTHKERLKENNRHKRVETAVWFILLIGVCMISFRQAVVAMPFAPFIPLAFIVYRLSPKISALAILTVAFIALVATLASMGPFVHTSLVPVGWGGSPTVRAMPGYYLYMLLIALFALPTSTVWTAQRRLETLLRSRSEMARKARDRAIVAEQRLRHVALHDSDTNLLNRAGIEDAIAARQSPVSMAAFAIDRFASISTAIGNRQAGALIERCAERIASIIPGAIIGRIAPDTLAIATAEPIRVPCLLKHFDEPVTVAATPIDVRFSVGLAGEGPLATAIHRAVVAVEQSRRTGSPFSTFNCEDEARAASGLTLLSDLRSGLRDGSVWIALQPKLDLATGQVHGAEVLTRWTRNGVDIPPDSFIGIAEETGFIDILTEWVVVQTVQAQKYLGLELAINISPRSLANADYWRQLVQLVQQNGGDPSKLVLEITESTVMADPAVAMAGLDRLRKAGFKIAIDDYGTGLSSLAYLRRIPADSLKMDRAFLRDLAQDDRGVMLIHSTVELAHKLGLIVVAEGVEDQMTLDLVAAAGCDEAQGYHIGRPMPRADLKKFIENRTQQSVASRSLTAA